MLLPKKEYLFLDVPKGCDMDDTRGKYSVVHSIGEDSIGLLGPMLNTPL